MVIDFYRLKIIHFSNEMFEMLPIFKKEEYELYKWYTIIITTAYTYEQLHRLIKTLMVGRSTKLLTDLNGGLSNNGQIQSNVSPQCITGSILFFFLL